MQKYKDFSNYLHQNQIICIKTNRNDADKPNKMQIIVLFGIA